MRSGGPWAPGTWPPGRSPAYPSIRCEGDCHVSQVDFGRYSEDYAAYRPGLPGSFYERLGRFVELPRARALDLATGPGTVALELGARGAAVVGIDVSPGQIEVARRLANDRGLQGRVELVVGRAEETGQGAAAFDLVTASQCWHWFERAAVLAEVRRVLRPGGVLAIVHNAYVPEHSALARDTEALILEFNPDWTMAGGSGTFPGEIDEVIRGGLQLVEQFCFDHDIEFSHETWRGRIRTCNAIGPSGLPEEEIVRFDDRLEHLLRDRHPDPVAVRHRLWCVVARKEPAP